VSFSPTVSLKIVRNNNTKREESAAASAGGDGAEAESFSFREMAGPTRAGRKCGKGHIRGQLESRGRKGEVLINRV
jgi:hypothetical protein